MSAPLRDFSAAVSLREAQRVLAELASSPAHLGAIQDATRLVAESLRDGHKVLACGNGGSLCDAMHFCEELTGRFRADRRALPAIACQDAGHLSCVANDFGYERVFSRFVEALGQQGDVLIVLTTSGNSANCLHALRAARERGVRTIALLGKDGGQARTLADVAIIVPGATTDRIQELHMLILHMMVEGVEVMLGLA